MMRSHFLYYIDLLINFLFDFLLRYSTFLRRYNILNIKKDQPTIQLGVHVDID